MDKRVYFRQTWLPWLLVAPQLAIVGVFFFWPAAQALYQSMVEQDAFGTSSQFVGAQNFIRLGAVSRYVSDGVQKWTKDNNRPLQIPLLQSPEDTRELPLALRSSDLQTVIAQLRDHPTDDDFTAEFRDRLIAGLGMINPAVELDQELLQNTQAFLRRELSSRLFRGYATAELSRILGPTMAPVKPASPDAPMKPAAPSFAETLGLKFASIPAGEFRMGSDETVADLKKAGFVIPEGFDPSDESPARTVRMSAFRLQTTEVTRGQFAEFVRSTNYRTDAEKDGVAVWAKKNDSRVTRVGAFIRKTRIDELPQQLSGNHTCAASFRRPSNANAIVCFSG